MASELLEGVDVCLTKKEMIGKFESYTGFSYRVYLKQNRDDEEYEEFYQSDNGATRVFERFIELPR